MTEAEWLAATHPDLILPSLRGTMGPRRVRLFAVACCRRVAHLLPEGNRCRESIEIAERYADRRAKRTELASANAAAGAVTVSLARRVKIETCARTAMMFAAEAVLWATDPTRRSYSEMTAVRAAAAAAYAALPGDAHPVIREPSELKHRFLAANAAERAEQVLLLRDIVGNPFRSVTLDPAWLAWNEGTVRQVAAAVYEERAFDRLPILADALEEAGCTEETILAHCRGPGAHARGCWVVDLMRGAS